MIYLQIAANGLVLGGLYACIAVGFSLVWGVLNVINILHGTFIVLGSYVAYFAHAHAGIQRAGAKKLRKGSAIEHDVASCSASEVVKSKVSVARIADLRNPAFRLSRLLSSYSAVIAVTSAPTIISGNARGATPMSMCAGRRIMCVRPRSHRRTARRAAAVGPGRRSAIYGLR
jgi:branched-subunit amino acid ABC-type transport system permease component